MNGTGWLRVDLTRAVADAVGRSGHRIGRVGTPEHMFEGLTAGRADVVLVASIFHYGEYK